MSFTFAEQVPDMQSVGVLGKLRPVGGGYQPTESTNINVMDQVGTTGASGTDVAVPAHVFNNPLEQAHLENVRVSYSTLPWEVGVHAAILSALWDPAQMK